MTLRGLCALGCACALLFVLLSPLCGSDREDPIAARVAVQNALRRGRDMMNAQQYEEAVHVLEQEIEHANGSREYLTALRDAYRSYIQQLHLAKRDADAEIYQHRLKILDPGSSIEQPAQSTASEQKPPAAPAKAPDKPVAKEKPPAQDKPKQSDSTALVEKARAAYDERKFDTACKYFDQANQLDPRALTGCQEQWAYSKLYCVVDQLQKGGSEPALFAQLEREVRLAMTLAPTPQLEDFGKKLLSRIEDRQKKAGSGEASTPTDSSLTIKHRSEPIDGWQVEESANIRVFHHKQPELAEKAMRLADRTRLDMQKKWLTKTENWSPPCDIYLHDTADAYSAYTKVPRSLPGHSRISVDPSKGVVERQVHVRCDDMNLLYSTLPHEVTHVVIASQFGDKLPPRWADEGVAVLTEPREHIDLHLRNLPDQHSGQQAFRVRDLMRMDDYPEAQRIGAFYAESVSVVDFLTRKREPTVFMQFVREGMNKGYDAALKKYYGYNNFEEMENDWQAFAFSGRVAGGK
jgi:hypothetical protein